MPTGLENQVAGYAAWGAGPLLFAFRGFSLIGKALVLHTRVQGSIPCFSTWPAGGPFPVLGKAAAQAGREPIGRNVKGWNLSSPYTLDSIFTPRHGVPWTDYPIACPNPTARPDPIDRYYALLERINACLEMWGAMAAAISGEQTGQGAGADC